MSAPLRRASPPGVGPGSGPRIPIPWSTRLRRFRQGVLPILTFLGCAVLLFRIWEHQGQQPNGIGEVEAVRVDVAVPIDGLLVPLRDSPPWKLLDQVPANAPVARLDDRPLEARLAAFRAELLRLRKTLEAEQVRVVLAEADRRTTHLREAARLAWQVEQDRINVLDRRAQVEGDRVVLERRDARVKFLTPLHQRGAVSELEMSDERLLRDEIRKRIEESQKALKDAEDKYRDASERLKQLPPLVVAEVKQLLAPVEAAVAVQEAAIAQIELEREWLDVRAPIAGTIVAVHRRPGQSVRAGDPVVTIAADQGRYIVGFVPQDNRFRPEVGMTVEVRSRLPGVPPREGVVDQVGPQVELIPIHQRRSPQVMEWGQPVRILMPEGLEARPGELLDLGFRPPDRGGAG